MTPEFTKTIDGIDFTFVQDGIENYYLKYSLDGRDYNSRLRRDESGTWVFAADKLVPQKMYEYEMKLTDAINQNE